MDKQFEMLGMEMRFSDIPEHGVVTYKEGKKDYWYNIYKFTEAQEAEWEKWALAELRKIYGDSADGIFVRLTLTYGFAIRYKKEGELF